MSRKTLIAYATTLIASVAVVGCQNSSGGQGTMQASVAPQTAQPTNQNATKLTSGIPPMTYLVAGGGNIRIVDVDDDGATVLKTTVPPQTVVRFDPKTGIHVGKTNPIPGPLPVNRRYEIWMDRN